MFGEKILHATKIIREFWVNGDSILKTKNLAKLRKNLVEECVKFAGFLWTEWKQSFSSEKNETQKEKNSENLWHLWIKPCMMDIGGFVPEKSRKK